MNPDDLKAGLANVQAGIEKGKRDALADAALANLGGELAAATRNLIRKVDAPPEPLERLLKAVEAATRRGRGRPTKGVARSVAEALTAAAVDDLMDADPHLTLDRACREVARKTSKHLGGKTLQHLRANIMRGGRHAPREAVNCYYWRRKWDNTSTMDPPAPMTLDDIKELWAALARKT